MISEILGASWPFLSTVLAFVVVIVPLVFVHEFGHFWVARRCGVQVETFSIGFGKEAFAFVDRHGTKWRFCPILLGGYVKMLGDADPTSAQAKAELHEMPPELKAKAFFTKSISQRSAIVAAGPGINFLFAIVLLYGLFVVLGQPFTPTRVNELMEGKPAEKAGILAGDVITAMNGEAMETWGQISKFMLLNLDAPVDVTVQRGEQVLSFQIKPDLVEDDAGGIRSSRGQIGVVSGPREFREHNLLTALPAALKETYSMAEGNLRGLWQVIRGDRKKEELGSVITIAKISRTAVESVAGAISFIASLSVILGVINLLPIPVLDGGHLLFYGIEAIRGRPLSEQAQEYSLRFGFVLILSVMVFALWNDLRNNGVVAYFTKLFS